MKRLTLDEARDAIRKAESYSYTSCHLNKWVNDRVVLVSRTGHCGGTEKTWIGTVSQDEAEVLKSEGVDDWR